MNLEGTLPECTSCGDTNPKHFWPHATSNSGYQSRCRKCALGAQRSRRARLGEVASDQHRKHYARSKYGLTLDQYKALKASPCEICGKVTGNNHVDHTHYGTHHGALCMGCNTAIGHLNHDPELLVKAADYVRRTRGPL